MIIVDWPHYRDYLLNAFKIFFFTFVIGRSIDYTFKLINDKYQKYNKKLFGLLQLIVVIHVAYILHIFTSNEFSDEFQISHPSILFSSFMITLQTNMFKNFGVI